MRETLDTYNLQVVSENIKQDNNSHIYFLFYFTY